MPALELNDLNAKVEQSGNLASSTFETTKPSENTGFAPIVEVEQERATPEKNKDFADTTSPLTNEQILAAYQEHLRGRVSAKNFKEENRGLRVLQAYLERRPLLSLQSEELEPLKQLVSQYGSRSYRLMSPLRQSQILGFIRHFYKWAEYNQLLPENPLEDYNIQQHERQLKACPPPVLPPRTRRYSLLEIARAYKTFLKKRYRCQESLYRNLHPLGLWCRFLKQHGKRFVEADASLVREFFETLIPRYSSATLVEQSRALRRVYEWLTARRHLEQNPLRDYPWRRQTRELWQVQARSREYLYRKGPPGYEPLFDLLRQHEQARPLSDRTRAEHMRSYYDFFAYLSQKNVSLRQLTAEIVIGYPEHLRTLKNSLGECIGESSRTRHLLDARYLLLRLFKWKKVPEDHSEIVPIPKIHKGLPRTYMNRQELESVLSLPDLSTPLGYRDRTIMEMLYSTAVRIRECVKMREQDIFWDQGLVRVEYPKGGKSFQRVVPVGKVALRFMDHYRKHLRKAREGEIHFFVGHRGEKMSSNAFIIRMKHYRKKAGIKKTFTSHSFRVTCATDMLRNKADIRHVQEMLGHRSILSTQIYTRVFPADLKKVHHQTHPRERKSLDGSPLSC